MKSKASQIENLIGGIRSDAESTERKIIELVSEAEGFLGLE